MKKVLIDVSSVLGFDFVSGIQRVVVEWTLRLLKTYSENVILFTMNNSIENIHFISNNLFINKYSKGNIVKSNKKRKIRIQDIDENCVLLDIDSVWDKDANRMSLYKFLKERNVKIVSFIHDIIPILNPQFLCDYVLYPRFVNYIHAILQFADDVVFSSNTTKNLCWEFFKKCGYTKKCSVVPFGNDLKSNLKEFKSDKERFIIEGISKSPFILTVGTIEPRKNHSLLFDAFSMINKLDLNLVIAGRIGWGCKDLVSRVKKHPLYGKKIFLLNHLSDNAINSLYSNCWAFVFPSFDEGFGLPVIEAAMHGKPIFCSDISIFRDITQNRAIYFDNKSPIDLYNKISFYVKNQTDYGALKRQIKKIKLITWDESTNILSKNILLL